MNKIAYAGCLGVMGIISTEFGIIGILPEVAASYHIPIARAAYLLSAFAFTIFLTGRSWCWRPPASTGKR
jgi:predicted MFS family arabinose efflux permease